MAPAVDFAVPELEPVTKLIKACLGDKVGKVIAKDIDVPCALLSSEYGWSLKLCFSELHNDFGHVDDKDHGDPPDALDDSRLSKSSLRVNLVGLRSP